MAKETRWLQALALPLLLIALPSTSAPVGDVHFSMIDQDGKPVTETVFDGKPTLLYFGFTSCPDVCPTDLAKMVAVVAQVERRYGMRLRPVFVTVDPERDKPALIRNYVKAFSPDFIGLTGSPAQVAALTRQYHVYYKKVPLGQKGHYTMDHSTFLFLLDAQGRYLAHYGRKVDAPQIVDAIGAKLATRKPPPR